MSPLYVLSERDGKSAINKLDTVEQRIDFTTAIEIIGTAEGIKTIIVGDKVTVFDVAELDAEATATLMAEQSELADYISAHEEPPRLPWTPEQFNQYLKWRR